MWAFGIPYGATGSGTASSGELPGFQHIHRQHLQEEITALLCFRMYGLLSKTI